MAYSEDRAPRFYFPTAGQTRNAHMVYQPITPKSRIAWEFLRMGCSLGALPYVLKLSAPPEAVIAAVAPHLPAGGSFSLARANHPERFVALLLTRQGTPDSVVKVALDDHGKEALEHEAEMLKRLAKFLPSPLSAPKLEGSPVGVLITKFVPWKARRAPWRLPADVAKALGEFFRAGTVDGCTKGYAHGDCAPWNLLRTEGNEWALIDWEAATVDAPPFHDLFHYLLQGHVLLGKPSIRSIRRGFEGKGWVGTAIASYAQGAGLEKGDSAFWLTEYLRSTRNQRGESGHERESITRRIVEILGPIGQESPDQVTDRAESSPWSGSYRGSHLPTINASVYEESVYSVGSFDSWIWAKERAFLIRAVKQRFREPPATYLDFACGTGRILSSLEGHVTKSTGVDISHAMLEIASKKVTNSEVIQGDITSDGDLAKGPFALITAFRFFLNAEEELRDGALRALVQRLTPGGVLIVNLHGNKYSLRGLSATFRRWILRQPVNQISYWKFRRELHSVGLKIVEVRGFAMLPPKLWRVVPEAFSESIEFIATLTRIDKLFATNLLLVCERKA